MSTPPKWTAITRKRLHVFRTKHPKDPPEAHSPLSPEAAWAQLRRRCAQSALLSELEPMAERLRAEFSAETLPSFNTELELARAAYVLNQHARSSYHEWSGWASSRELISLWSRAEMRSVLAILLHKGFFWVETTYTTSAKVITDYTVNLTNHSPSYSVEPQPPFRFYEYYEKEALGLWCALRAQLNAFSETQFKEANHAAHLVRESLAADDSYGRIMIAFAFSRDPAHVRAEFKAPEKCVGVGSCLLMLSCSSFAEAAPLYESSLSLDAYSLPQFAFELVEMFGHEAAPLLHDAAKCWEGETRAFYRKEALKPLQAALKLLE